MSGNSDLKKRYKELENLSNDEILRKSLLKKAKGFVFGYFSECEPGESKKGTQTYMDLIKQYVGSLGKPVITNFACGHDFPFVTLPIGVKVRMDADQKTIEILEEIYETSAN